MASETLIENSGIGRRGCFCSYGTGGNSACVKGPEFLEKLIRRKLWALREDFCLGRIPQ